MLVIKYGNVKFCEKIDNYLKERELLYFLLESVCVVVFIFEYLMWFIIVLNCWYYVKEFMSVIDLFLILLYYVGLILDYV